VLSDTPGFPDFRYSGSPVMGERIGALVLGGVELVKLNMLVMGFAMESYEPPPILPRVQLSSINRVIEVWMVKVWSM
jgi:hypothetical protein